MLGQPEVRQVGELLALVDRDEDVRRLHVSVDQAASMGRVERPRHRSDQRHHPRDRQGAVAQDHRAQVGPPHVPHRDEQVPVLLPGLVHGDDVRVLEAGRELGLPDEAGPEGLVLGELLGQHLDRDLAAQAMVLREEDHAHAPSTQQGIDRVVPERLAWAEGRGHRMVLSERRVEAGGASSGEREDFSRHRCVAHALTRVHPGGPAHGVFAHPSRRLIERRCLDLPTAG